MFVTCSYRVLFEAETSQSDLSLLNSFSEQGPVTVNLKQIKEFAGSLNKPGIFTPPSLLHEAVVLVAQMFVLLS